MPTLRLARVFRNLDGSILTMVNAADGQHEMRGPYVDVLADSTTIKTAVVREAWMALFTRRPDLVAIYDVTAIGLHIGRPVDQAIDATATVTLFDGSQVQVTGPYFEIFDECENIIDTMLNSNQGKHRISTIVTVWALN